MAEGRNIEIKIAATGGREAASELAKPKQAIDSLIVSEEGLAQKRAQFLTAAQAEVAEVDRMVAATQRLKAALPQVPFSQTGNVISEMANGPLKNGTSGVKNLGMTFTQVGYQVTDFTTQVSMGTSAFTAFAQQAPQAIAALTQFGGAGVSLSQAMSASVGAMLPLSLLVTELAIGIPMLVAATNRSTKALDDEVIAGQRAEDMFQQLKSVLYYGAEAYYGAAEAASKLKEITDQSTASIDAERQAIENRNKVLNADDGAANAKRDREDAAKIRNGADPETVKIERANFDESQKLAKLARDKEARDAGLKTAETAVIRGQEAVDVAKVSPDATPEKITELETQLKTLQDRLGKMQDANELADRVDKSKSIEIREQTSGKIEGLADYRSKRKQKEIVAAKEKQDREKERETDKSDTTAARRAREAGSTARSAEGLIPKGVSDKFRKDFQTVSDGLQNGDQGGEVAKMLSMIESLANEVEKKGNDKDLSRRLDIMEQRIRNLGK